MFMKDMEEPGEEKRHSNQPAEASTGESRLTAGELGAHQYLLVQQNVCPPAVKAVLLPDAHVMTASSC